MPKVPFAEFGDEFASSRLRATIPKLELEKLGIKQGKDVLIYGKHVVRLEQTYDYKRVIFDICNDHFEGELKDYYITHARNADLITVNSSEMARVVKEYTGLDSMVIPDPYESEEKPAGIGNGVLWFGHQSNISDLVPFVDIDDLQILTNDGWSRGRQIEMLSDCACVIIPKGKSIAKSANRLIESVRNGRFVLACDIPSHEEFKPYMIIDNDIKRGLDSFKRSNPADILQRIRDCQDYIRNRYSPGAIARLWLEAIEKVWQSTPTQHSNQP
jgi:hypothetical protein